MSSCSKIINFGKNTLKLKRLAVKSQMKALPYMKAEILLNQVPHMNETFDFLNPLKGVKGKMMIKLGWLIIKGSPVYCLNF